MWWLCCARWVDCAKPPAFKFSFNASPFSQRVGCGTGGNAAIAAWRLRTEGSRIALAEPSTQ